MIKFDISELMLYRRRYWIGYGLVAIGLVAVLIFAGMYLPGGISNQEMQSVVKSSSLSLSGVQITNLPYHLLQHAILAIFGVSILSIKLPSIILAFLSAIGIALLLKRWFKPSVGVLASLIAISTGQFLFIAQDGTPGILYLFWSVCLLLLASLLSYQKRFRSTLIITLCIATALSLYTPLSMYALVAIGVAVLIHPHLRYLIKQLPRLQLIIGSAIAVVFVVPLIIALVINPSLWLILLGIPTHWPNLGANLVSLGAQYFGFSKPGGMTLMTPFFELGSMLIIAIGAYHAIRTNVTAKNYVIILWSLCLIPVIVLNPTFTSITFLPLVLLLATGLNTLLAFWYNLFPRNPYARISGLAPIIVLVTVLVFSGTGRYVCGYRYDPTIVPNFSNDLKLIPPDTKNLVVSVDEMAFYKIVARSGKRFNVTISPTSDVFLATRQAHQSYAGYTIDRIITSSTKNQADRFYLYSTNIKSHTP